MTNPSVSDSPSLSWKRARPERRNSARTALPYPKKCHFLAESTMNTMIYPQKVTLELPLGALASSDVDFPADRG